MGDAYIATVVAIVMKPVVVQASCPLSRVTRERQPGDDDLRY
ncbi:hypothetical protein PF005_g21434 [Phytophthora fragariae]|uniref:Uncharacterized protein n=1 Tax=Phytophthora fragariae TaxID=53985 RepID=A0A6A3E0E3_9STRA|nr:hypothetical protein PF003_g17431 [Phytophthora fragariae]KAE8927374.1 hypothetical protein PF009_g22455 [Phytophthora fragariae]KAE8986386.1 hypothetical protein PF011_g20009 [Phytophthora fragariae]KAE9084437.1 hypothetical protein PF007_g21520 [Phytophthora fragariae]KAE9086464.1 hypothetical protein PF010_g20073 [Phytophthora fragariae]